ncbi:MAG: cytochrome c oxidase subunit II [Planctomycetes bacterium]|nr:cytochrome c oxidase subunit II [Planctomycetota bacterium]
MSFASLLAVSGGPAQNLSIFDPVSPPAESIRDLAFLIFAITGLIFLIVEGILLYSVFRFRHGPPNGGAEPPQVYGSTPIEIAWTAAPALIVFVMTLVITRTLWEVNVDPKTPPTDSKPLRVTVIGHQWWWEYVYESYDGEKLGFITANELHVPASNLKVASERRPVYLTLQSADVCHSFWVPRLAGKMDLIPGRTNSLWFETGHKELFLGQCAEFCGTQHAKMLLRVNVDAPDDFARWLLEQQKPAIDDAKDPKVAEGKKTFLAHSCVNCHRVRGTSAVGSYGPDLTHLMSRKTLASGILPNSRDNLRKWIADPQVVKPGCLMPAFGLSAENLERIVDYLASLR